MKVYIGADHAGFDLKSQLIKFLENQCDVLVEDLGAHSFDQDDDYPDFILPVAQAVKTDTKNQEKVCGIVLGGSGQGEALAANRVEGVRAAVYYGHDIEIVRLSRLHNDANVLSLGARFLSEEQAKEAAKVFLDTEFSHDERHKRRIAKLDHYFA